MHDVFVYTGQSADRQEYFLEYDQKSSGAPPLLSLLKRHILRSKVRVRDMTDELSVWAVWGSDEDRIWDTQRSWTSSDSGVIEPVWKSNDSWPWGSDHYSLLDRRAVGLGRRLLIRRGDERMLTLLLHLRLIIDSCSAPQAMTHDKVSSTDYTYHRIMLGVPEGSDEIPSNKAFPMEANLDIMGAGAYDYVPYATLLR